MTSPGESCPRPESRRRASWFSRLLVPPWVVIETYGFSRVLEGWVYRVPGRPLETFYRNAGDTRRYGVETSLGWFPTSRLAIELAYTFSDFEYTNIKSLFGDFQDQVMPNAPRHQVALDPSWRIGGHFVVGLALDGQSLSYVDQTNTTWIDGFVLVSPRLAYRFKSKSLEGELRLSSRNVFGKEYIAFTEPDPDGNSYQPGPTREVFAGVQLSFH
jgi:iron complex outermembrane receptor protein